MSVAIAVSGFPRATIYNQLIEMEWQEQAGEVDACGGDAIYRIDQVSGRGLL